MLPEKRIAERTAISGTVSRALSKQKTCWALFLYAFDKNQPFSAAKQMLNDILKEVEIGIDFDAEL